MRKMIASLVLMTLMTVSVQAAPSLGGWNEGDFGTTHQYWSFSGNVNKIGGGWEAIADPPVVNPNPGGLVLQINDPAVWNADLGTIEGSLIVFDIKVPNYPNRNAYKEIWVDLGLERGTILSASVVAGDGSFSKESLKGPGPHQSADFGFLIRPNPDWEDILVVVQGVPIPGGFAPAILDYVHVDTICVPAPGAVLLGSFGVGLIGWLRRRRTL